MLYDFPLEQLKTYKPERNEPGDFDAFWQNTLEESRRFPLNPIFTAHDAGLKLVDVFDVTFNGFHGQPIKGWLMLPRQPGGKLPCVVEYLGYGGGRGHPFDFLLWSSVGYAHLVMDTRGQGSVWRNGDTPDLDLDGSSPQHPGFMTRGIYHPETYYYRRLMTDAVRAVETARAHPQIDPQKIAVTGGSQGGGLSLAVSGLVPDLSAALPDVPYLCHYRRATEIIETQPYEEISQFCRIHRDKVDTVFQTLSYFDGMNFAARAKAPALFSAGLMDDICPPSTVFAAYNHYQGNKDIRIWPYNHHEGGQSYQSAEQIKFLANLWK